MSYPIKEIPTSERPRERLKKYGSKSLSNHELLAIILKTGTKNNNVTELALDILKEYSIDNLQDISINKLTQIKGIGEVKALELLAVIELGKRIYTHHKKELKKLTSAKEIFLATRHLFINEYQENLYALYFNTKQELLEIKLLFVGTVNESIAHPREIFKEAYRLSATYIVCIHNHPSNDTTPSKADMFFTEQLMKTGQMHGIKVVDHIISGSDNFYSFYENKTISIKEEIWKKEKHIKN